MVFPEWAFVIIGCIPCFLINILFPTTHGIVIACLYSKFKSSKGDQFKPLLNEIRSIVPLFKKGSSETETLLFNFQVPIFYVLSVFLSIIYVFLVAVAIFWQTAFIEEVEYDPGKRNSFCYESQQKTQQFDNETSQVSFNCYHFTVRFGDALTNAAGVFTFYVIVFGLIHYIFLKSSNGKDGTKMRKVMVFVLVNFFLFVIMIIYTCIIIGVVSSNTSYYQISCNINYLTSIYSFFIIIITMPWWRIEKLPEQENEPIADLEEKIETE